jgi:hypothetical protein
MAEKRPKVCIDRVLPPEIFRSPPTARRGPGGPVRAVFEFRKMWINGSTLRVRFLGGTSGERDIAREQAGWWSEHANLKFDFNDAPDAEIRIAFDTNDGAWSWVGTDSKRIPQNQPTMNLGFLDGGTAGHEFGHAIGLGHEHQNPAGGIEWIEEVVIRDLSGPPNNWNEAQIRHNVLNKYRTDQIRGTQFDGDSIMLYFFPPSWTRDGKGTKANEVVSSMDGGFIASSQAYPKTEVEAVELEVNAARATSASIGNPGEEDLFKFTANQPGRYIIATRGSTDVIMKLFGPDSQTQLIAEDDDSGVGTNARIVADLIPGVYYVQIRHYYKATGTGNYTIRVRTA